MIFFHFLKIIFDISTLKRYKTYKLYLILINFFFNFFKNSHSRIPKHFLLSCVCVSVSVYRRDTLTHTRQCLICSESSDRILFATACCIYTHTAILIN